MRPSFVLISLLLLGLSQCATPPMVLDRPADDGKLKSISIVFTSNRQGEVDPCGCVVNQLGGLDRFANFILRKRAEVNGPLVVADAGDTFFPAPVINPSREAESKAKAEAIAQSYALLDLAVFLPGERDLAYGVEFARTLQQTSRAKFVASNLLDEASEPVFEENFVWEKDGTRVGFFGVVAEDTFLPVQKVKTKPWKQAAAEQIEKLKGMNVDFIVALSHLGLSLDRELAQLEGISLVIGSHSQDVTSVPVIEGKSIIVQPHAQGHQVGFVQLVGGNAAPKAFSLVDLGRDYDGKNQVSEIIDDLKRKIGSAAMVSPENSMLASKAKPYVAHAVTCRKCHQEQYAFWEKTKHSSAYLVLFSKGQHFNPECIGCHSLGFQQPGGYDSIAWPLELKPKSRKKPPFIEDFMKLVFAEELKKGPLDSRLQKERHQKLHRNYHREIAKLEKANRVAKWYIGVQCEHCHGNRNGHPHSNVQTIKRVSETACKQCHIPPNAPNFDPASIKRVACPLMKRN